MKEFKSSSTSLLRRRDFCAAALTGAAGAMLSSGCASSTAGGARASASSDTFIDLSRTPDVIQAFTGTTRTESAAVRTERVDGVLRVHLASSAPVSRVLLRWHANLPSTIRCLGDHWERGYGDLEWRGIAPNRVMPWYVLAHDGQATHGYGVRVRPAAMCFWTVDEQGISLWLDVRNGAAPVELGNRALQVCDIICRRGNAGESPFQAARAFCAQMSPKPLLPKKPILGTNDWYYAYGDSHPDEVLRVTEKLKSLAPAGDYHFISLVDGGWAPGSSSRGPWDRGNNRWGDMGGFAQRLRGVGAEAGIWFRPLGASPGTDSKLLIKRDAKFLDPSLPETLEIVAKDTRRFREWGYTMIKHDYTCSDILGRWGFDMGSTLTNDGWSFADRSRTTAEIVLALYQALRDAAGDALVIGCNTFSHLSAGLFEINRTGDDVSGKSWDRTRRMGVNTLAFRAPQHNTFYAADPDITVITREHPWSLGQQWIRLVAESSMPLFISPQLSAVGPEQESAIKDAFAVAASNPPLAEPLDWLNTTCPRHWRLRGKNVAFNWMPAEGTWPFKD